MISDSSWLMSLWTAEVANRQGARGGWSGHCRVVLPTVGALPRCADCRALAHGTAVQCRGLKHGRHVHQGPQGGPPQPTNTVCS